MKFVLNEARGRYINLDRFILVHQLLRLFWPPGSNVSFENIPWIRKHPVYLFWIQNKGWKWKLYQYSNTFEKQRILNFTNIFSIWRKNKSQIFELFIRAAGLFQIEFLKWFENNLYPPYTRFCTFPLYVNKGGTIPESWGKDAIDSAKLTQRELCSRRWQTKKRKTNFSSLENIYETRQTKVSRVYTL